MTDHSVCAVIVTFHPSMEMIEHINRVLSQVSGLVVVDNGSSAEELKALRTASQPAGFTLIENEENLGIAEALNQGARWAKSSGYNWILLLDQDTKITDNFVCSMLQSWREHPKRDSLASLHPRYVDIRGLEVRHKHVDEKGLVFSMTSGSLLPSWIFDEIGWFASEYFIDYVDIEFCLRARAAGFIIGESKHAVLYHSPGVPEVRRLLGIKSYCPSNHSPLRRYYFVRNRIATARRYFRKYPLWTLRDLLNTFKEVVKILLGERNRRDKLEAMLSGAIDGVVGRMGKRQMS